MTRDEWIAIAAVAAAAIAVAVYERSQQGGSTDASGAVTPSPGISGTILSALASFENVATGDNNPGGICGSFDASGNCIGPAHYDSLATGLAAAEAKITSWLAKNPGISAADFVEKWSGATGQVLENYINHVTDALGIDPTDPIATADTGETESCDENGCGVDF